MITTTELEYVRSRGRDVPFPNIEYAVDALNNLEKAFNIFNDKFKDINHNIVLSNGEEIVFKIDPKNLCHLLGIDFKIITKDYMGLIRDFVLDFSAMKDIDSYELIERIIEKKKEVLKHDSNSYNRNKILNYYRVFVKSTLFSKLSNFDNFDFGCINFNKDIYQELTKKIFYPNSNKLLFLESKENLAPYFIFGLIYDDEIKAYAPETIFLDQDFYNFFLEQELLLPTELIINNKDELTKKVATNEDKLKILRMYRHIIEYYNTGSYINIFNDYLSILNKENDKKMIHKI